MMLPIDARFVSLNASLLALICSSRSSPGGGVAAEAAERVRREEEVAGLTQREQSDTLRLQQMQAQLGAPQRSGRVEAFLRG